MPTFMLKAVAACALAFALSFPAKGHAQVDHPERETILQRMNEMNEVYSLPISALRQSANGGDLRAMLALSVKYQNGAGVPQSTAQSNQWRSRLLAASTEGMERGDGYARYMHTRETWIQTGMSDSELLQGFRLAADAGVPEAMYEVGVAHQVGRGTPRNKAEALRWFEMAGTGGHCEAMTMAAALRLEPTWSAPNAARGIQWYRLAAEDRQNCGNLASYALGLVYSAGAGSVPKNYGEALRYLAGPAEQGNQVAMVIIGFFHQKGLGVPADPAEALRRFRAAGFASVEAAPQFLAEAQVPEPS